jgi:hypothetical protein
MYVVRFNKEALRINICNLCPSLELTSPVYCSKNTCRVAPSQQTDTDNIMEAIFVIDSKQKDVNAALLYKLQRKYVAKADNQPNTSTTSINDTATKMYLLVVWDGENEYGNFYVCLIECTDDFNWDEDKLWALHEKYNEQFLKDFNYNLITWLVYDGIVMKMRRKETYGSDYKLDIFISEETGAYNIRRPKRIDPKRLVLPLSMLIVLMYAVSLPVQLSIKLNIHNQCLDVNLVSPVYITSDGLECHKAPDYKVYAGDTMRSGFIIKSDISCGALIYKLQGGQSHESIEIGENTSSAVCLLVVWKIFEYKELYADILLVKHASAFTWNEDKLRKFYYENRDRLKEYTDTISDTWLMDDNMILKTSFSARDLRGILELSISISEEEKFSHVMRPFCINPER